MRKTRFTFATLILCLTILSGCGSSDDPANDVLASSDGNGGYGESSYTYEYCQNCSEGEWPNIKCATSCSYGGCTTGKKSFSSQQAYCSALRDDAANNYCHRNSRKQAF